MKGPFISGGGASADLSGYATVEDLAAAIQTLIGVAPAELDTLGEIIANMDAEDQALLAAIAAKQDANARLTALSNGAIAGRSLVRVPAAGQNPEYMQIATVINTLLEAADAAAARAALGVEVNPKVIASLTSNGGGAAGALLTNLEQVSNNNGSVFAVNPDGIRLLQSGIYIVQAIGISTGNAATLLFTYARDASEVTRAQSNSNSAFLVNTDRTDITLKFANGSGASVSLRGLRLGTTTTGPYQANSFTTFIVEKIA